MNPNVLGEKIGQGTHQAVYVHGDDEQKVVKVTNETYSVIESQNFVKARFYLTKILHHFFPKQIPDVHLEASNDNKSTIVSERVFPSQEYEEIMKFKMSMNDSHEEYVKHRSRILAHKNRLSQNPQFSIFLARLDRLDVSLDTSEINFAEDMSGNIVFLDKIDVHLLHGKKSLEKMRSYIQEQSKAEDRAKLLSYLDRYESLINSESQFTSVRTRTE